MQLTASTPEAYDLLHRGAITLASIERHGIRIDTDYLDRETKRVAEQLVELNRSIKADEHYPLWKGYFGDKTKIGSHEQLACLAFDLLKLPYPKPPKRRDKIVRKTNRQAKYRADEETLSQVDLPIVHKFLELKATEKVYSTYLGGIRRELVGEYIHPFFDLHTARSFRSSSSAINFQNQPIRDPIQGKVVRRCFIARDGCYFTEVDSRGNEIVGNACINKDPVLIDYVKHSPPKDMHRDTAMQLFFLGEKEVAKQVRHVAKNRFVFPQFYGDFYASCARYIWEGLDRPEVLKVKDSEETIRQRLARHGIKELGECDPDLEPVRGTFEYHVREVERDFWQRRFRVYSQWRRDFYNEYLKNGYFSLPTGFVVQGIFGRNEVTNYPAQGSSFHFLLLTLILLQDWLIKNRMRTRIVGQIHDSIISDTPANELQDYLTEVRRIMTEELPRHWPWIIVPLSVECEVAPLGATWNEKAPYLHRNGIWAPEKEAA